MSKSVITLAVSLFAVAAFGQPVAVPHNKPHDNQIAPGQAHQLDARGKEKTGAETQTQPGEGVSFVNLKDGQTIPVGYTVKFAVNGKRVKALDQSDVSDKTSGHHHLIIDAGPIPAGQIIPVDPTHMHFGKGQTEAALQLPKGPHTLTLQFADAAHASYGPAWSSTVKVNVK